MSDMQTNKFDAGGTKTFSFFINLLDPDFEWNVDDGMVIQPATIDRWMIRMFFNDGINEVVDELAELDVILEKDKDKVSGQIAMSLFNQDNVRQNIVEILNKIAAKNGFKAHQLQALGWVRIRNEYDRPEANFKDFKDVMKYAKETTSDIVELNSDLQWINKIGVKAKGKMNKVLSTIHTLSQTPRFKFKNPDKTKFSLENKDDYQKVYELEPKEKKQKSGSTIDGKFTLGLRPDGITVDVYTEITVVNKKTGKESTKIDKKTPAYTAVATTRKDALKDAIRWIKTNYKVDNVKQV